jgi:hypothetical protein
MTGPLLLTAVEARTLLGIGKDRFTALVRAGVIPSWTDPETGWRRYSRPVLEAWAANLKDKPVSS